ncbi:hypothetical protein GH714_011270 [Hevea brasiliensis]|uniref:ORM1-like protein 3 n=1 Tax=Hevea brasiliensis TaxID=3981 RepID=A0A6A6MNE7_HEVBR|nr:hypothetical protein GH714_011270 [Hevea brasiliensis]
MYVKAVPPTDLNRNTEWFTYPGVWTTYMLMVFMSWLIVLSLFGCSPGMAWTIVHLAHFLITYHFFHWKKGTPFADDQGIYNGLTWWEQIENGKQLTRNRKFLTVVPVVLVGTGERWCWVIKGPILNSLGPMQYGNLMLKLLQSLIPSEPQNIVPIRGKWGNVSLENCLDMAVSRDENFLPGSSSSSSSPTLPPAP